LLRQSGNLVFAGLLALPPQRRDSGEFPSSLDPQTFPEGGLPDGSRLSPDLP